MPDQSTAVPQWGRFEQRFTSHTTYANPLQDATLRVTFAAPSGAQQTLDGFWDGGTTWRVRFSPNEPGTWTYTTACSDADNAGLHAQAGEFSCSSPQDGTRFDRHGPVRLATNGFYLEHADGTPFFFLADTAWNGPLRATAEEWAHYLAQRTRQGFSAVQWVATQWRAAPDGDITGHLAYTGTDEIAVNPDFFQRLDGRVAATAAAGLLNVPVLLWTNAGGDHPEVNPGVSLPEDQAALLARYMVARWGAFPAVWILPGDGDYGAENAERWRQIGRATFGDAPHAPVALHCRGRHFPADEFRAEAWCDIIGYQSGHGDSDETWAWIVSGPPAQEWQRNDHVFYMNMEPAYENHVAYHSQTAHAAHNVRRAIYWSLLNAPTAGVTYGGHGVWGWDDGSEPPVDHPRSGIPLPWREALTMDAAEQMAHLTALFTSIEWWRLRPDAQSIAAQPGEQKITNSVLAARSANGDLAVVYAPGGGTLTLDTTALQPGLVATWFNPRTGARHSAADSVESGAVIQVEAPDDQDWVLLLQKSEE